MERAGLIRISVVIPTYRRPAQLRCCLEALAQSHYPIRNFEVVVVDDGGGDDLEALGGDFRERLQIRILAQEHAGPAAARNTGARYARGAFIAFTDDDCAPEPEWLGVLVRHLERDSSGMYGGLTVNALSDNAYSSASQSLIDYLYGYYNANPERGRFFTSNNMAVSREVFASVGGFDEGFPLASGEDRELCDRWLNSGFGLHYVSEARVLHRHELNLRRFWRQHFNYGTGAWRFRTCRRLRDSRGPGIEPPSFYLDLLGYAHRQKLPRRSAISLLLLLSQFASAAGFLSAVFRRLPAPAAHRPPV